MKEKRNGFTLIELLAVIIILAIIALIAVPTVMNIIEKASKSAFKDSAYGIIKVGELYYAEKLLDAEGMTNDKTFTFPNNIEGLEINGSVPTSGNMKITKEGNIALAITNGKYCITKGYYENDITLTEDIENCLIPIPIENIILTEANTMVNIGETKNIEVVIEPSDATNKRLKWTSSDSKVVTIDENGTITGVDLGDGVVTVETQDGSNIKREIKVQVGYRNKIMRSTSNCINEGNCTNGTRILVEVNDTEKYNFYTIKDDGINLTLIMNKNLENRVAWINYIDYANAGGTNYGTYGANDKGPLTVLKALKERTKYWINIPSYSYTLEDDKPDLSGSQVQYQPISDTDVVTNVRARLLTYTEAKNLGCTGTANSCPIWLYENLSSSNTEEAPYGYWLSTSNSSHSYDISLVDYNGYVRVHYVYNDTWYGVRPVIATSKTL